ncbi:MAG: hypothetical protein AB7P07_04070 [Hyphomonadaceae bacterium]
MIDAIDAANTEAAIDLLAEGFPLRSRDFWADCVERIRTLGGNEAAGVPLGFIMRDKGAPVGVVLIIGATRPQPGGGVSKRVNFSAWCMKPAHRWKAPLMIRKVAKLPVDLVTDLTASREVARILPTFGFQPITAGISILPTPAGMLIPGPPAQLRALDENAPGDPAIARMLLAHARFGCIPMLLSAAAAATPIMFKMTRLRGMRAARVIYCGDKAMLRRHVGAVSAFVLSRGALLLLLDLPLDGGAPGFHRPGRSVKFAIGAIDPASIDYAGSELAVFDL